jgi:hypothetical protein
MPGTVVAAGVAFDRAPTAVLDRANQPTIKTAVHLRRRACMLRVTVVPCLAGVSHSRFHRSGKWRDGTECQDLV